MSEVMSLRLSEEEEETIERLSKKEKKDKSKVTRELIKYGEIYRAIKLYKEGKISLGKFSSELDISISEAMDLLTEFGIKARIDYEEYLQGKKNLEKVW